MVLFEPTVERQLATQLANRVHQLAELAATRAAEADAVAQLGLFGSGRPTMDLAARGPTYGLHEAWGDGPAHFRDVAHDRVEKPRRFKKNSASASAAPSSPDPTAPSSSKGVARKAAPKKSAKRAPPLIANGVRAAADFASQNQAAADLRDSIPGLMSQPLSAAAPLSGSPAGPPVLQLLHVTVSTSH